VTRLTTFLASLFIRALHATLRVRHVHAENLERLPQYIIAFWHAHLLLMVRCRFRRPISVMISRSKDGELIAGTMSWFGVDSARGSTSRNSLGAMREMLRTAKAGTNLVFTPDGPRGPSRVASEGVVYAAQLTGLPIVPIVFNAKKKSCCTRGTGSWCRIRSQRRSSSMASRSRSRGMTTSKPHVFAWKTRSTVSSARVKRNSMSSGSAECWVLSAESRPPGTQHSAPSTGREGVR
jgi:lysophospholipid acyltransferase (LPLAT)-like uncharacterized protein